MNKKLDKSLLPQPQKPVGWKRGVLQISTDSRIDLKSSNSQLPVTTKYGTTKKNTFSNNQTQQQNDSVRPNAQTTTNLYETNRQSRQSIQNKPQMGMTASQYSLEQKQLLTFAANQSNEDQEQDEQNSSKYNKKISNQKDSQINIQSTQKRRTNRFEQSNQSNPSMNNQNSPNNNSPSSIQSSPPININRSSSKSKQHKTIIYKHNLPQNQQFIAYSVVIKESKSGMFSNQKLLMLNSYKRQLVYYSKLPKFLPFASYNQMQKKYFIQEKPKEVIELDKVRRFMFVPAKGSLASVAVSYVNEKGEKKEWKVGMGNNTQMNEWIELVNEVVKKEHFSIVKSQVKYPPKPKKQPQNKSNNYQTKFTKTLKQQVLPVIKQSSIRSSKGNQSQLDKSHLSGSGLKASKNELSKSREKQYVVDKSKFVNTKSYIIDLEDVSNEDIFYEPELVVKQEKVSKDQGIQQSQTKSVLNNNNNNQNSQKSISSRYWQELNQQSNGNSRFSQQLQQRQRQINNQHKNRVSNYMKEVIDHQQQQQQNNQRILGTQTVSQPVVLSRKLSGERLSQTTHKDLNIHIGSRVVFGQENYRQKEMKESGYRNQQQENVASSQLYDQYSRVNFNNNQHQSRAVQNNNNQKSIIQPKPVPFYPQTQQSRKRVYIQAPQHQQNQHPLHQYLQNLQHQKQWQKITFLNDNNNSDSIRSSSSSHYEPSNNKPTSKDKKYRLEQPPTRNSRTRNNNNNHNKQGSFVTDNNSQIQDIIVGGKLHDGYILNFSPYTFGNNWFRLWLETETDNRIEVYASFVKAARSLVKRIVDNLQQFVNCYSLQKNNTNIIFSLQNITFKLPFKLPLPQGLGQFISVMDFCRSQDFLSQVFKYQTQLCDEFNNYQYILNKLSNEFNSGVLSLPIYFPMCCLVKYKGISVLCKANWEGANLNCYKVHAQEVRRYEKELEYVEDMCHVRFGFMSYSQENKPFDLYSIHVPSFSKTIIYMDNLIRFLPLMPNPLHKNPTPSMQLTGSYIDENIKKGMISSGKDIEQIEKHLVGSVIKRYGEVVVEKGRQVVGTGQLRDLLYEKGGLRGEYLGGVYRRVEEREQKIMAKSLHASSLILTQIVIIQYSKACQLYFMKEYFKQLYTCISNSSQNIKHKSNNNQSNRLSTSQASNNSKTIKNLPSYTSVTTTFGQSYSQTILQILHYLIYRNSKVWTVLSVALDEKYGIGEFRKLGSQRQAIDALMGKICVEYLVLGLMDRLGVEVQVKSWANGMTWGTLPLTQDNLNLAPYPHSQCFPLSLFNPQYSSLISQLRQTSTTRSFSSILTEKNYFSAILQILNISQETHQNQSIVIKSAPYELLQFGFTNERQLIDLALSYFIPTTIKDTKSTKIIHNKYKTIELYQKILNQQQVRTSKDVSINTFQVTFNGIKWLIKQNQFQLAQVLIQQQLQAISIWYTQSLLQMKCKFLDLAATFYHKKLNNRNNLAIQYAMRSLQIAMDNKLSLPLSTCAQKCFQAANIHFDCGFIEKSLELYELAEKFVFQSQKNKSLEQTDLSIEFLKIYLRKAEIKLAMGRKNQTLYECLECLRKCQEFEDLLNLDQTIAGQEYVRAEKEKEQLSELEINVFQLIFRTYQITKNLKDMQRIAQLCCTKFFEDKILILKMTKHLRNKTLEDSVNPSIMSKLLKMCWVSIINKIKTSQIKPPHHQNQQHLSKTMTIPSSLTRKSFCLSGALSQPKKTPQLNHYQKLQQLLQKLQALCKLYPKNRYDRQTLSMFVCREVVEASARFNFGKNMGRGEYQLIGSRKKGVVSGRVEQMISMKRQGEWEVGSMLFERLGEVVRELMDSNNGNSSSKRIERYQTESSSYYQRQGSRQKQQPQLYHQSIQTKNYPFTSSKKQPIKFYHSPQVYTSQFDQQNSQGQPQLRMSFILGREQSRNQNISTYDIYSLKDQMDKKYMLMEALFGLCGRDFVLGGIMEAIDSERRKVNGSLLMKLFYE